MRLRHEVSTNVVARRADFERSHGRFVAVDGIRMHYLEWGDAKDVPLVWANGSGSDGYELRAVALRLAEEGSLSGAHVDARDSLELECRHRRVGDERRGTVLDPRAI